jgi:hypothetical protein
MNKYVVDRLPQLQELADHYQYQHDEVRVDTSKIKDLDQDFVKSREHK